MKWLLILFVGIIVVPALAQNTPINQTDYQKLNLTVNGLHTDHIQYDSKSTVFTGLTFFGGILVAIIIGLIHFKEIRKQNRLIDDVRSVYADAYVSWIQLAAFNFEDVIRWYDDRYVGQPISQLRENTRRNLIDHYDRDLLLLRPNVETIELVKVFGKKIADKIWTSTGHMRAEMWQPDDDNGMDLMIKDYKKLMKKAIDLKNALLPYCTNDVKIKDQSHAEIYEKINTAT